MFAEPFVLQPIFADFVPNFHQQIHTVQPIDQRQLFIPQPNFVHLNNLNSAANLCRGNCQNVHGNWSKFEDYLLTNAVMTYGINKWDTVAKEIPGRSSTQCRERWLYRISPGLKKTPFEPWEDDLIITERKLIGNRWSQIASKLPGRTSCSVKNRWYTILKRRQSNQEMSLANEKRKISPCDASTFKIKNLILNTNDDEMTA